MIELSLPLALWIIVDNLSYEVMDSIGITDVIDSVTEMVEEYIHTFNDDGTGNWFYSENDLTDKISLQMTESEAEAIRTYLKGLV